ncbi:glycerate kinase [Saccharopolyspora shandongensis]|uniref:glycerate kinase family protein n=1 Tax=Saccharopolyspora shandongensis TaxID=418495 RepID=UPI003435F1BF
MASVKILVAPDSFKGTYTAREVAGAIGRGLAESGVNPVLMPVADGGEGTLDVLAAPLDLRFITAPARNPWGTACGGTFAVAESGTAFVELAEVCGIAAPHDDHRDPIAADTYGVGMLMAAATRHGAERIVVATGGSATTDGGTGALCALEEHGGLRGTPVTVLTDVTTPYLDAARVFGPQKGASPAQVAVLAQRLRDTAARFRRDPALVPGTGAAGGFAGAMWAEHDAELVSGADFVLDALAADEHLAEADAIVLGEGRIDSQSSQGKIVSALLARSRSIPRFAVVGSVGPDLGDLRDEFRQILVAGDERAMRAAGRAIGRQPASSGTDRRVLG